MEIRTAYLKGEKPKRVFVAPAIGWDAAIGLAGLDKKSAHYDLSLTEKAMEKINETFPSDTLLGRPGRLALVYQLLGAKNWIMASDGTVQHPEVHTMEEEDYDDFINAPYKTIIEKFLPRACTRLSMDTVSSGLNLTTAYGAYRNSIAAINTLAGKLTAKYGYVPGFMNNQQIQAPFDFIADQLRGFTRINMDVRRIPEKVKKACDVITPMMVKMATPAIMRPGLISFIPLHLGSYLNKKAFDELFWPSLEELIVTLDKKGIGISMFVEENWTRYAPLLATLPKSTIMYMEQGDPKVFTDTVGKDHVIGGFYDPTISLVRSKEECIDEAKRLLDITMKCGKYYFCFDKGVIDIKSINVSSIQAVLEWVTVNAKY